MGIGTLTARYLGSLRASYEDAKWQRLRASDPDGWAAALGRESTAGKVVTVDRAMQLATVWACVKLTAQAISSLPIGVYDKDRAGGRVDAADSSFARVLKVSPNMEQTSLEYWESMVAWMATRGVATSEIVTIGNRLSALLPPVAMKQVRDPSTGVLSYEVISPNGERRSLPRDRVFVLKWFDIGTDRALSPIRFGADSIGASMAADESAARLFANGITSSGLLTTEGTLKADQRMQLEEVMKSYVGSSRAGKLMILEAGLKYEQMTLNPEDAQLLETRRFNIEEICRWFGVPPIVVGHAAQGQTMWGSGVEQILLAWLALGINPLAKRIEARVAKQLSPFALQGREVYLEFNREGLLQMDSTAKAAFLSSMTQNGLMDRNEGRAKLNLPRREGADQLTAQVNLAPLDQLGAADPGGAAQAAFRSWLGITDPSATDT